MSSFIDTAPVDELFIGLARLFRTEPSAAASRVAKTCSEPDCSRPVRRSAERCDDCRAKRRREFHAARQREAVTKRRAPTKVVCEKCGDPLLDYRSKQCALCYRDRGARKAYCVDCGVLLVNNRATRCAPHGRQYASISRRKKAA